MTYPLVAPLAALMAGIAVAQYATFSFRETLISITLLAGLAVFARRAAVLRAGAPACLAGFALAGALLASLPDRPNPLLISTVIDQEQEQELANFDDPIRLRGYVRIPTEPLELADQFVLEVESIFEDTAARGGVRVTVRRREGDSPLRLEYGRRIEFLGRLRAPRNFGNPGSFDHAGYLQRQGIHLLATVRPGTPIHDLGDGGGTGWEAAMWNVRRAAKRRLDMLLSGGAGKPPGTRSEAEAILKAMLLGDRSLLDRETTTQFQRVGTYHALVISGLHVGGGCGCVALCAEAGGGPATAAQRGRSAGCHLLCAAGRSGTAGGESELDVCLPAGDRPGVSQAPRFQRRCGSGALLSCIPSRGCSTTQASKCLFWRWG